MKKLALEIQLLTVQILTNGIQVLILCLSYFITTVSGSFFLLISKCVCQLTVQYVYALDKGQKQTNKDRSDRPSINCKGKLYQEARHSVLQ